MARRGENIYKRRDGRWEGRYIESYSDEGRARYRSVYAHTYKEVRQKLSNTKTIKKAPFADISAAEWVENYILMQKEKIKITTYNVYLRYYKNHIFPFFKNIKLRRLCTDTLQVFVDSKSALAPSTLKGIFTIIKEALKAAYGKNYIDDIWSMVELPKNRRQNVRVFTKDEQRRIEDCIDYGSNTNEIGVLIGLYTGLRLGEICGLKWGDIDLRSGLLSVRRTVQRMTVDGCSLVKELPPKSESSARTIPVPSFLAEILQRLRGREESYVISSCSKITDPRTMQNRYRRLLARAGVTYANFHTLRHTFSVRALENGFDIKTLSEILGHADASITLRRYAHSLDEHKRSSMERLGGVYGE